jgi:hypothetical protein
MVNFSYAHTFFKFELFYWLLSKECKVYGLLAKATVPHDKTHRIVCFGRNKAMYWFVETQDAKARHSKKYMYGTYI